MNPYVDLDPLRISQFMEVAILFSPAFVVLAAVVVISSRSQWLLRHRPTSRFKVHDDRSSLWSLPVLVWAFEASFFTLRTTRLEDFYRVGFFGLFTHVYLLHAFLTLCLLVALQVIAVLVVERGRLGLGAGGHFRVSMIYALIAVVLDSFLLLSVLIGNWPKR